MKTTGVSDIPKFGLLDFLGHPTVHARTLLILPAQSQVSSTRQETQYFCKTHDQTKVIERINNIKSSENENTISLFTLNCRLLGVIWYPIVKSLLPQNQNLVNDHELSAMWVLCDRFRSDVITMWCKSVFLKQFSLHLLPANNGLGSWEGQCADKSMAAPCHNVPKTPSQCRNVPKTRSQ